MQAQADMQKFILKIMSACLAESVASPLLIQMPIFSALYFTARYTQGIPKIRNSWDFLRTNQVSYL